MKKQLLFLLSIICLCGCNQLTINDIAGDYSYATSGMLTLTEGTTIYDVSLDNVMGTLDIQRLPQGDSILLVFNELLGDLVTVRAEVKGDSILMPTYQKVFSITTEANNSLIDIIPTRSKYIVSLTGDGYIMDDMIVFNQRINSGKLLENGRTVTVKSNSIKTVAKKNKK